MHRAFNLPGPLGGVTGQEMNTPLTIEKLIEHLQRFDPGTPCVGHVWTADDFEDLAPELTG